MSFALMGRVQLGRTLSRAGTASPTAGPRAASATPTPQASAAKRRPVQDAAAASPQAQHQLPKVRVQGLHVLKCVWQHDLL